MKKIFTLLFIVSVGSVSAQPVIDGKYLPVPGTAISFMYDNTSVFAPPAEVANANWDYSQANGNFLPGNTQGPYYFRTQRADSGYMYQSFPAATHTAYSTAPVYLSFLDSAWIYSKINIQGFQSVGFYSLKKNLGGFSVTPAPYVATDFSMEVPQTIQYNMTPLVDTFIAVGYPYINIAGNAVPAKVVHYTIKTMSTPGWGTLTTPLGTFSNVMLAKAVEVDLDSFYTGVNFQNLLFGAADSFVNYSFLRNNTFATSLLMNIHLSQQNTDWGRYTLPAECGSISGTVRDTGIAAVPVTSGMAFLYREKSNFSRNDILDVSPIDQFGHYQFDSIPYGQYRISVRANKNLYPKSFTTYHGQTQGWFNSNWHDPWDSAATVTTFNIPNKTGVDITLLYEPVNAGTGHARGGLYFDWFYSPKVQAAQPIPGVDIIAKRNPGGVKTSFMTDQNGQYDLGSLPDGNYRIFVDVPGVSHANYYDITIAGGNTASNLNWTCGKDSMFASADLVYINSYKSDNSFVSVYPNPFSSSTNISVTLKESSTLDMAVYNAIGEKVMLLENNSSKAAGNYNYDFSASVPSGIYFVNLRVNGVTNSFKIVKE